MPENIKWVNAITLIVMALLILFAISPWNAWRNTNPHMYGWNLFSYFTVLSNLIAAGIFLTAAYAIITRKKLGDWFRSFRGAGVLYMLITGVIYALFLQNNPETNPAIGTFDWKNFVLHQLVPIFMIVWWLLWPASQPVSGTQSVIWLLFPLLFVIYSFIRGAIIHWYPYPFLDPAKSGGVAGVSVYVLIMAIVILLLAQLVAWISRVRANNQSLY